MYVAIFGKVPRQIFSNGEIITWHSSWLPVECFLAFQWRLMFVWEIVACKVFDMTSSPMFMCRLASQ